MQLKILIIDDNRDFAESIKEALELQGHDVEIIYTGEDAVQRYRQKDFDIAFMDLRLPGMNGVECFQKICQFKPDSKVVIVTSHSQDKMLDHAIENGVFAVLYKPLDIREVFKLLDKITKGK